MRSRAFLVTGLVVTLLLAGVASYYASSHPDGLEFVADRTGFADSADDGGREARSGGAAGVAGVLIVLVLAGGLGYALRRRTPAESSE